MQLNLVSLRYAIRSVLARPLHALVYMTQESYREERMRRLLDRLADRLIRDALRSNPSISEGAVMTEGPPAYRRLDCDGRALAYVRSRPRKGAVRIDLSGLWVVSRPCRLQIPSASGAALIVRSQGEIPDVTRFLCEAIMATRATRRSAA